MDGGSSSATAAMPRSRNAAPAARSSSRTAGRSSQRAARNMATFSVIDQYQLVPNMRRAATPAPSLLATKSNPRLRRTRRAARLPVVVSARTPWALSVAAVCRTPAIASRPTPWPRVRRVSQMPVSRISGTAVRLSRTEPTTWSLARMAQVASPTGPLSPLRRVRWKSFNHAIRAGDHSSPARSARDAPVEGRCCAPLRNKPRRFCIASLVRWKTRCRKHGGRSLAGIAHPEIGVVTNVAPVHLEFFKSVEEIARAKYELVTALPRGGVAVLNADDEYVSQFGRDFHGKVITYGIARPAEVRRAAARACGMKKAEAFLPNLIALLYDADPEVVQAARSALKTLTDRDEGPEPDATPEQRRKAQEAWRSWWQEHTQPPKKP